MGILVLGAVGYQVVGVPALLVPPVLIGIFLAYLIVESRHYQLSLFVRQKTESRSQFTQMEAILGLTWAIDPAVPLPNTRGWAASPDLLREIFRQVLAEPPELVIEASSGTSTLVIAYALQRLGRGRVIALEHEAEYAERTRQYIATHGLQDRATVVHAPLVRHEVDGQGMLWYDLTRLVLPGPIDLLVVDGPPDTVQPMARYPAVPLLRSRFNNETRVILDDGARHDERVTADRWSSRFKARSREYLDLEKGGWLLRFHAGD
jgi:hypothetical protein